MLWLCIRLPALLHEALAASEREAIERLAAWAYQWSSLVSYRLSDGTGNGHGAQGSAAPQGGSAHPGADHAGAPHAADAPLLWLELGASRALFGSHATLLARIESDLAQLGYSHACALAPSPAGSALLTRAEGQRCVFTRAQLRTRLAALPLSLLELPAPTVSALQSAGLRRIGEVLALPAAALARRFGPDSCLYLARLTGAASDPRPAWRLPDVYRARCEFGHELHDTTLLLFPLRRLLQEFEGYLRARDCSVQQFKLQLEHPRRAAGSAGGSAGDRVTRVTIGLAAPAREAARFLLLARERLQTLALAAPICALELTAREFTAPSIVQADLFGSQVQQLGELSQLLDRLRARLGEQAVQSFQLRADHRPERAWRVRMPEQLQTEDAAARTSCPARPAALLPSPPRIAAPHELLSGPERIESGWWDGGDAIRDYYIARAGDGARLWVFRDLADGGWYLQGLWV